MAKTTTDHVNAALKAANTVSQQLAAIDLRALRGPLRNAVRDARTAGATQTKHLYAALTASARPAAVKKTTSVAKAAASSRVSGPSKATAVKSAKPAAATKVPTGRGAVSKPVGKAAPAKRATTGKTVAAARKA